MMEKNNKVVDFSERVKILRDSKGLSQKELADKLGMTRSLVSTYENGQKMPTYGKLIKLARVFDVSTDYLLGVENESLLDLSGLKDEQLSSVKNLVAAMQ